LRIDQLSLLFRQAGAQRHSVRDNLFRALFHYTKQYTKYPMAQV
jgi:cytochrome c1